MTAVETPNVLDVMLSNELPENCREAAYWWHTFGLKVAPMNPDTKHTAVKWQPWLDQLEVDPDTALAEGFAKDNMELCAIVDSQLFILDADSLESKAALYEIERAYNKTPNLIQNTKKGEHHFFRKAPGTYAHMASFSSEKEPHKIDVRTGRTDIDGRSVIALAPSTGKSIELNEADTVQDLVEVGQDFIDAIFRHNGQEPPRAMLKRAAPEVTRVTSEPEAKEILSWIPSDCGYGEWIIVLMGTHEKFMGTPQGLYLVDEWSAAAGNYCGFEEIEYKWRSFNADRDSVVTWSSVCELARNHGADLSEIAKGYNPDGSKKRTYVEILEDANGLDRETEPDSIQALVAECRPLPSIERRKVFDAIKENTGIALYDLKAAMKESCPSAMDQLGLAHSVIKQIGRENLLSAETYVWYWSDKGVWDRLEDRMVKKIVQTAIPKMVNEVNKKLVDGVADLLKTDVYVHSHQFNVGDSEVVNCLNGQLHFYNGFWQLQPHNREDYRTSQIPIVYDPQATAPRFEQFLMEVTAGDADGAEKRQALLEMMGYSLMAHCNHEKFVILIGSGANGKTVLLFVLEQLVGRINTAAVQPSEFHNKFQRAHLHGKLVNIVTELKQGAVIDDEALKGITSGEVTTVENKHRPPFDMRPYSTCWFGTNHMPHTRDFSDALFRRALLVEFNNKFEPHLGNCDPNLKDKLLEELAGILNMALHAYAMALKNGFTVPASTRKALQDWRMEADQVAQFVAEACELSEVHSEKSSELYAAYVDWARDSGIKQTVNARSFKERLLRIGIKHEHRRDGKHYLGIQCHHKIERFNAL